ncbi:hypothetical protein Droror1_Dr00026053 [Drosera rotundifolia]
MIEDEDEEMLVSPWPPHREVGEETVESVNSVESQLPMEECNNAAENHTDVEMEPSKSKFTWTIENFSQMINKKHYSDEFLADGLKWRILIFPKGNKADCLSMYIDVADAATLPLGWSRSAKFSLCVVNQVDYDRSMKKDAQHQFNIGERDWGFTTFMRLRDIYNPTNGFLVNDRLVVEAEVALRSGIIKFPYDSKKETGYVGLENQGATCYMNSLLQTLYHIPCFRKAVYHMPTTDNDNPSSSIPLAMQRLFYKLQYNDSCVSTKELTKSFGWGTYDAFFQHDVQELNRVLCEKLEYEMKATVVEGTIQQIFEGHIKNYIECINVDYKSTRKESFYDIQLDVKDCRDVYASFDKYVAVERLEGENKYEAEDHGLQEAKKGALFLDFPPVLQLQLKRFEYDVMRETMVKINDRYEFPLQLDLDKDNGKYLAPEADRSIRNLYSLHSVLVHSGGLHGGHYYAFIRPTLSDLWFKFDDERVTKEDTRMALEEQYGGDEIVQTNLGLNNTPFGFTNYSNAYMLVYVRESDKEKILCNVTEKDIAEHLRMRLKREQEEIENRRRYEAEAHLYTIIKVARDEDFANQIGKARYFDLVDIDRVRSFRIRKQMPFKLFKEMIAKELRIPVEFQRYWSWVMRKSRSYRLDQPLTPREEDQPVWMLSEAYRLHNEELMLFLEVELGRDLLPTHLPNRAGDELLLLFKLYDFEKKELRYVGRLFVISTQTPMDILKKLNEMAGFPVDEEIELYEELKFDPRLMCPHVDKKKSFRLNELEDGDIICFQKSPSRDGEKQYDYPDVPSFMEYVLHRQIVHFRSLEKPKEDKFCLELSRSHTYDDVVEKVAQRLGLDDPSKIRLTSHNVYCDQPKPQPIRYRGVDSLFDMLRQYNQMTDILYYEVLDIPLSELEALKVLKVAFLSPAKDELEFHNVRLPKQSTVQEVINELKFKVKLSHNAELRLLQVFQNKIFKILNRSQSIESIDDNYWSLRAEEIPEEEKNMGPDDHVVHVAHYMKDMHVHHFGEPFFMVIHKGETLAEIKPRIQKKLNVLDEELSQWKFAYMEAYHHEYLQDSDVVFSFFQKEKGPWQQYLGLEHKDTSPKRPCVANQNRHAYEKPIKIYN